MKVEILNGKNKTYQYKSKLYRLGFRFIKNQNHGRWTKDCKESELKKIKRFCKKKKLEYAIYEDGYTRSSNYRYNFFKEHPGFLGKFYQCAYCGHIHTRKNITVDHIIPVDKVIKGKKREKYKKILKRQGIEDVNDVRNLVAACKRCNQRKSSNTGFWILKARIGKHPAFWLIYYTLLVVLLIFTISNFNAIVLFLKNLFINWISTLNLNGGFLDVKI